MTQDSLINYWYAQNVEMRGALLAFWRTMATCPNTSQSLFAGVVATLQRLKHE
jgi:hypothetical protein